MSYSQNYLVYSVPKTCKPCSCTFRVFDVRCSESSNTNNHFQISSLPHGHRNIPKVIDILYYEEDEVLLFNLFNMGGKEKLKPKPLGKFFDLTNKSTRSVSLELLSHL